MPLSQYMNTWLTGISCFFVVCSVMVCTFTFMLESMLFGFNLTFQAYAYNNYYVKYIDL